MLKDITLGQYFPGSSPLHRLDPRTKIILTIVYIVGVFLADSVSAFIAVTAFTAALVLISRIPMPDGDSGYEAADIHHSLYRYSKCFLGKGRASAV